MSGSDGTTKVENFSKNGKGERERNEVESRDTDENYLT